MKHIKKFEDVYYEPKQVNTLREFKPTDEQVENLESRINYKYKEELSLKDNFIITHIEYYDWDEKPRWYVTLVNEAKLELSYLLEKRKKKMPFSNRNGENLDQIIERLRKSSKYIELDIYPYSYSLRDANIDIEKIEYAGHGYPVMSTTIWKRDNEK